MAIHSAIAETMRRRRFGTAAAFAAVLLIASLLNTSAASAGRRESMLELARVLSYQKKYDGSLERYDRYLARYPDDMQARLEAGDVAMWSGDYDRAISQYEKVLGDAKLGPKADLKLAEVLAIKGDYGKVEKLYRKGLARNPDDIETRIRLAQILSYDRRYDESIAEYDAILERDPGNLNAMRGRADVLSWAQRYDESVTAYDALLEKRYDADAARQKARVLGWAKRYRQSIEAYREAYDRTGVEAIRLEMKGKESFWNGWPLHAIEYYREVLEEEPENAEARFDLGQTEGYERMWSEAAGDFSEIIRRLPSHFRASDSLERVNVLWKKRELTPAFKYFRARSDDRATHINRYTAEASFRAPFNQAVALLAGYAFDFLSFDGFGSIPRDQGVIGLDVSFTPRVWGRAVYKPTGYPSDDRLSHLWSGSVSVRAADQLILTALTERDDLYNQRIVFDKELRGTNFGGMAEARLHRRFTAFAAYRYRMINDSNKQNAAGVEGLFYALYEPKRLTVDIRFDWQDWKYSTADYWSPQNFWHISTTIHWRHYLNPDGIYYGALNTYYGVKYRFQIDRQKEPFNGGAFEFHRDFSRRISAHVEAFGNYSRVYWDIGAMARFSAFF